MGLSGETVSLTVSDFQSTYLFPSQLSSCFSFSFYFSMGLNWFLDYWYVFELFLWSLWPSRKWQSKKVHEGFEANHVIVFTGGGEVSIHSFYARSQECTGQGFDQHWWSPSAHFCLPSCSALNTWYWPLWYPTTYLSSSLGILQSQYPSFVCPWAIM